VKSRHCAATNARRTTLAAGGIAFAVGTILLTGTLPVQAQSDSGATPKTAAAPKSSAPRAKAAGAKAKGDATVGDAKSRACTAMA
jgi:hypothetical protein